MDNLDRLVPVNKLDRLKSAAVKVSASPLDGLMKLADKTDRLSGLLGFADPILRLKTAFLSNPALRSIRNAAGGMVGDLIGMGYDTRGLNNLANDFVTSLVNNRSLRHITTPEEAIAYIRSMRGDPLTARNLQSQFANFVAGRAGATNRVSRLRELNNLGWGNRAGIENLQHGYRRVGGQIYDADWNPRTQQQFDEFVQASLDDASPITDSAGRVVNPGAGGITDGMTPEQQTEFIRQQAELARRVSGGGGTGATGWLRDVSQRHPVGTAAGAVGVGMMANNMMGGGRRGY